MASRHIVVAVCFLATCCVYVERLGFSIAYTRMAREAGIDEAMKGRVLSAFFWGYALSQVPGGACAQRFGGRPLLLLAFMLWSITAILTPSDATRHRDILLARVLTGIVQGLVIPSIHTVLSECIPPNERAVATSITTSGMYLGSAAAMWLLPSVVERFGPEGLLRLVGMIGSSWALLWYFVSQSVPSVDGSLPIAHTKLVSRTTGRSTPWKLLLSSVPVWAIVVNNFTFHYAFYVVMNWLPTYFNELLKAELTSIGAIKTIPYLFMFVTSITGGWLGEYFIRRWKVSVARGRKLVNSLGFMIGGMTIVLMPFAKSVEMGILWTAAMMGAMGLSRGGFSVNHMDIAPNFAGIVMGISNTAGTLSGVIGVATTGVILEYHGGSGNTDGWISAFSIAAILCFVGNLFFLRSAKGERLFE